MEILISKTLMNVLAAFTWEAVACGWFRISSLHTVKIVRIFIFQYALICLTRAIKWLIMTDSYCVIWGSNPHKLVNINAEIVIEGKHID